MTTALFTGSFDPFTIGHADIVERALPLFDEVVIAVGYNEQKQGGKSLEERLEAIRKVYRGKAKVRILAYQGLTAELVRQTKASCIIKGVRSVKDYEYEQQMADVNKHLCGIDTLLFFTSPQYACISSSVVRELAHFGEDITPFLPVCKTQE